MVDNLLTQEALDGLRRCGRGSDIWHTAYNQGYLGTFPESGFAADEAAVNVNFWIAPDEVNLNPEGGGLGIWDKQAPLEWDFAKFNDHESAA